MRITYLVGRITYLVGKIKFKHLFQGPLAKRKTKNRQPVGNQIKQPRIGINNNLYLDGHGT